MSVENISLSYDRNNSGLLRTLLSRKPGAGRINKAVDNVSFAIREGDVLGLVGRNGSGKSTIGMMLSGCMEPDRGSITRTGSVQLLSLGVGFKSVLSGRENVYLSGSLLGLTRLQVMEKMDEIISFSELEEFIDEPMRTYSAGMRSRLAFAVATVVKPDVLILDEMLSTGDPSFRRKAEQRIHEMQESAKAVVVVSHSINQLRSICNRLIWIDNGRVIMDGPAPRVLTHYEEFCADPSGWMEANGRETGRESG